MTDKQIDIFRSEQRFAASFTSWSVIKKNLDGLGFQEVYFSENQCSRTVYFGGEEEVPWGTSIKARCRLASLSENLLLDSELFYQLSVKVTLNPITETAEKRMFGNVTLAQASAIISTQFGKNLLPSLITEYRRGHFILNRSDLRITADHGVRFWDPRRHSIASLLATEDFVRIEVKADPKLIGLPVLENAVSSILNNDGWQCLSKKETGYGLLKKAFD